MKRLIITAILTTQTLFALVSIKPVEIGVKPGISSNVEASFETKRGNSDKDNYNAALRITYDNNKDFVAWGEISGEYGKSNNKEDTHKAYVHFRYIHALTPQTLRAELFLQAQENRFKNIQSRRLGGMGVRYSAFSFFQKDASYFGAGAFYETISYTTTLDATEENIRANTYFVYSAPLGERATFAYGLYYQPLIKSMSDYTLTNSLSLKLTIYKELFLKFQIQYNRDSQPPSGVKEYDFTQTTSFMYNF